MALDTLKIQSGGQNERGKDWLFFHGKQLCNSIVFRVEEKGLGNCVVCAKDCL